MNNFSKGAVEEILKGPGSGIPLDHFKNAITEALVDMANAGCAPPLLVDGDWFMYRASYMNQKKVHVFHIPDELLQRYSIPSEFLVREDPIYIDFIKKKDRVPGCFFEPLKKAIEYRAGTHTVTTSLSVPTKGKEFTSLLGKIISLMKDPDFRALTPDGEWAQETTTLEDAWSKTSISLNSIYKELVQTHYVGGIFLFFSSSTNWRTLIDAPNPYKGERKKDYPPIFVEPFKNLAHKSYVTYEVTGCEADDIIAMAAQIWNDAGDGLPVVLSSDADFHLLPAALVGPKSSMLTNTTAMKYSPYQRALKKILVGDVGDNIKGLHGIGEVKASKILDAGIASTLNVTLHTHVLCEFINEAEKQHKKHRQEKGLPCEPWSNFAQTAVYDSVSRYIMGSNLKLISLGNPLVIADTLEGQFVTGDTVHDRK